MMIPPSSLMNCSTTATSARTSTKQRLGPYNQIVKERLQGQRPIQTACWHQTSSLTLRGYAYLFVTSASSALLLAFIRYNSIYDYKLLLFGRPGHAFIVRHITRPFQTHKKTSSGSTSNILPTHSLPGYTHHAAKPDQQSHHVSHHLLFLSNLPRHVPLALETQR